MQNAKWKNGVHRHIRAYVATLLAMLSLCIAVGVRAFIGARQGC
jgi:hypothetical protein